MPDNEQQGSPLDWYQLDDPDELTAWDGDDLDPESELVTSPATFEDALEALGEVSISTTELTGFSDLDRASIPALRQALQDLAPESRATVADSVFALSQADLRLNFGRFFQTLLGDDDGYVRQLAASYVAADAPVGTIRRLAAMAESDPDSGARLAAITALGEFVAGVESGEVSDPDDIARLSHVLDYAMDATEPSDVRSAALISAARNPDDPRVRQVIDAFLASGDSDASIAALHSISTYDDPDDLPVLERALRSYDVDEREIAVWALGQFDDPSIVPMITMVAREDDEPSVRAAAYEALGRHGSRQALDALRELQQHASDDEIELIADQMAEIDLLEDMDGSFEGDDDAPAAFPFDERRG